MARAAAATKEPTATLPRDRSLKWLPLDKIVPNDRNPRGQSHFKAEELQGLRRSIEQHGILEPLIVQPYEQGLYLLIEGERRWTVAKSLGLKEVPCVITKRRLDDDDQVTVMYNLHENRRGWEMADHLRAIQTLMKNNPDKSEEELARELGLSLATFRDRLRVLGMGDRIVAQISRGEVDYTSALRSAQAASAIAKKRPELAEKLGGEKKVADALIKKAKAKGGISHELTAGKQDLTDRQHVPDEVIEEYLTKPEAGLRELRMQKAPAQAQRASVRTLAKNVLKIEEELRELEGQDLTQAPNLLALHNALEALIGIAQALDAKIVDAMLKAQVAPQTEESVRLRGRKRAAGNGQDEVTEGVVKELRQGQKAKDSARSEAAKAEAKSGSSKG